MRPRPAVAAAGIAVVAAMVAGAVPAQAGSVATTVEAEPQMVTAAFELRGDFGGRDLVVTAEPSTGRIQVSPYYWDAETGGRFIHVGLGAFDGDRCDVTRRVVVDAEDLSTTTAYDAEGNALAVQSFDVGADWAPVLSRVEISPFAPVDCVKAASHPRADPTDPGRTVRSSAPVALVPGGFKEGFDIFPATVRCPREVAAGGSLDITVGYSTQPGPYAPAGLVPRPSSFDAITFTPDPPPNLTVTSTPEPPSDVDLWADAAWTGDLVLDLDPSALYFVTMRGTVSVDGVQGEWTCGGRIPVTVPVPTDWVGSLAGTTWWTRGQGSKSGIGPYTMHRAYEFLDDEWVYVEDEYVGARTEPCLKVSSDRDGCHRYYYDAESNRLQIDDRLARPRADGWGMPVYGRYENYSDATSVRPVTTGQRFGYSGSGMYRMSLTLRRDGTYRCTSCGDSDETWNGRYRFIGGDVQELVLRKRGSDFRSPVALYYAKRDGRTRLFDIDTASRLLRVQRW